MKHQKYGKKGGLKFRNAKKSETKRGVGMLRHQKYGNKKKVGPLIAGSMVHGSYFNTSKGRGLEMGGNVESQKRNKKRGGNIEIQKNGKKRGVGLLRHQKNARKRGVEILRHQKNGNCGGGTKRYGA